MRRMFRYEVQVNDLPQRHIVSGEVHGAATRPWVPGETPVVEFWAENDDQPSDGTLLKRTFQIFGTGHPLPDQARWRATTERDSAGLVWHLYEMVGEGDE